MTGIKQQKGVCVCVCGDASCVPAEVYANSSYIWDFFVPGPTEGLRKAYVNVNHPEEQYSAVTQLHSAGFPHGNWLEEEVWKRVEQRGSDVAAAVFASNIH